MAMLKTGNNKLKLHGFNNLTKQLSFNIYDICYAQSAHQRTQYIEYIDEEYNTQRLTKILTDVANIIGATVLNVARQDYDPQGASVTMLIAEEKMLPASPSKIYRSSLEPDLVVAHLDKSHITVHTYPESHPNNGVSTFRVDIDVATCGQISPLNALNHLIHSFDSDIVIMDYRVRGFTRDKKGKKHYIDHKINSIRDFIDKNTKQRYQMTDFNVHKENIFHTKMILNEFDLDNYLFEINAEDLSPSKRQAISQRLKLEMEEIYCSGSATDEKTDKLKSIETVQNLISS